MQGGGTRELPQDWTGTTQSEAWPLLGPVIDLSFLSGKDVRPKGPSRWICLIEGFAESLSVKKKASADGGAGACLHLISVPHLG